MSRVRMVLMLTLLTSKRSQKRTLPWPDQVKQCRAQWRTLDMHYYKAGVKCPFTNASFGEVLSGRAGRWYISSNLRETFNRGWWWWILGRVTESPVHRNEFLEDARATTHRSKNCKCLLSWTPEYSFHKTSFRINWESQWAFHWLLKPQTLSTQKIANNMDVGGRLWC